MRDSLITIAYIAASALFIMSLGGLSRQETARRGNLYGILGMLIALVATAARMTFDSYTVLAAMLIPGAAIGALVASRVQMTAMPQLVAILHSFVGAAAVLVGFATYLGAHEIPEAEKLIHNVEIFIGVCIGSITFTGSVIAFGKLQGTISGRPLLLPGRHILNLLMLIATVALGVWFAMLPGTCRTNAASDRHDLNGNFRHSFRHGNRRRGYAGRRFDAQQLFGLGGGGGGFYARQRSADYHRRTRRQSAARF